MGISRYARRLVALSTRADESVGALLLEPNSLANPAHPNCLRHAVDVHSISVHDDLWPVLVLVAVVVLVLLPHGAIDKRYDRASVPASPLTLDA